MWDVETGKVEKRFGKPVLRPKGAKTLCEIWHARVSSRPNEEPDGSGCEKGYWWDNPDLNQGEEDVIELYMASKASGGAMLTEAERNCDWLASVFAALVEVDRMVAIRDQAEQRAVIIAAMQSK